MIPSLVKVQDFLDVMHISRYDAFLWLITFVTVTIFNVNIGIITGLVASIAVILLRVAIPSSTIKYPIANSEVYLSPEVYDGLNKRDLSRSGIAVFAFQGPLTFLSAATFATDIQDKVLKYLHPHVKSNDIDELKENNKNDEIDNNDDEDDNPKFKTKKNKKNPTATFVTIDLNIESNESLNQRYKRRISSIVNYGDEEAKNVNLKSIKHNGEALKNKISVQLDRSLTSPSLDKEDPAKSLPFLVHTLVLDATQMLHIDVTGIDQLIDLKKDLQIRYNVRLLLACCSTSVLSTLGRAGFFKKYLSKENVFITVHDAVFAAQNIKNNLSTSTNTIITTETAVKSIQMDAHNDK